MKASNRLIMLKETDYFAGNKMIEDNLGHDIKCIAYLIIDATLCEVEAFQRYTPLRGD